MIYLFYRFVTCLTSSNIIKIVGEITIHQSRRGRLDRWQRFGGIIHIKLYLIDD